MVNKYRNNLDMKEKTDTIELDFDKTPNILKDKYLDVHEGIQSEILNATRFDENSDLSATYLGKSDKFKVEKSFPVS